MATWLSFLVCVAHGTACHIAVPLPARPYIGLSACQVAGMQIAPHWTEQHPGMRIDRIRCSLGNRPHEDGNA